MSENSSQEPTMEEILASIRRIISEDDAPAAEPAATPPHAEEPPAPVAAAPEPEEPETPVPPPAPEPLMGAPEEDEDDLELTEKIETHGDLDVYTPGSAEALEDYAPAIAETVAPLVSDQTAEVAASAFGRLSAAVLMPAEGRTLEDVVRELLRPLLQQWLDDNLPGIVQQAVAAEVERIARGRVR